MNINQSHSNNLKIYLVIQDINGHCTIYKDFSKSQVLNHAT